MHYSLGSNVIHILHLYTKGTFALRKEAGTSVLFKLLIHVFQMFVP